MTNTTISVAGAGGYDIVVGRGLLGDLPAALGSNVQKVMVIYPQGFETSADAIRESLLSAGYQAYQIEVPTGEDAKRIEVAAFAWAQLGQLDFTRSDAIIGFGGGAVTDVAGFIAGTWLRGVKYVVVPTTLLGMVDAAIGGKTAVNTAEGKNLVGVFHAPAKVLVDLDTLATLPRNELLAGFGEVVKYGFIADERILEIIEANLEAATNTNSPEFREIVERCVAIKARVVGEDFKEAGLREILNYGHTLGHAIELNERYQWRHGAAISIGMVFVAELARLAGRLSDAVVDRHRSVLQSLGLPTTYRASEFSKLMDAMQRDKKSRGGSMRFVVLDDLAKPTIMNAPTNEMLFAAYQEIAE